MYHIYLNVREKYRVHIYSRGRDIYILCGVCVCLCDDDDGVCIYIYIRQKNTHSTHHKKYTNILCV
jgi:hypothetical protein